MKPIFTEGLIIVTLTTLVSIHMAFGACIDHFAGDGQFEGQTSERNSAVIHLEGQFINSGSSDPVEGVEVTVTNIHTNQYKRVLTNREGKFSLWLSEESIYAIVGTKSYFFNSEATNISTIGLQGEKKLETSITIEKMELGKTYVLPDLNFSVNEAKIDKKYLKSLDIVYRILRQNPRLIVEIGVHTDARGDDDYNLELSQKRAEEVVGHVVSKGIHYERVKARGYGEARPLNGCRNGVLCNATKHLENRRTEFKIVGLMGQ